MPFHHGVFQLAFKAFEEIDAVRSDASLRCVPIAIKYVYEDDMQPEIDESLARLEAALAIPTDGAAATRYARMRRAAEAILAANEKSHRIKTPADAELGSRIDALKLGVVAQMENQLGIPAKPDEPPLDRVRALFNAATAASRLWACGVMEGSLPSGGSMMSHGRLPLPCKCSYQWVGPAPVSAPPIPPAIFAASSFRAFASD